MTYDSQNIIILQNYTQTDALIFTKEPDFRNSYKYTLSEIPRQLTFLDDTLKFKKIPICIQNFPTQSKTPKIQEIESTACCVIYTVFFRKISITNSSESQSLEIPTFGYDLTDNPFCSSCADPSNRSTTSFFIERNSYRVSRPNHVHKLVTPFEYNDNYYSRTFSLEKDGRSRRSYG